MVEKLSSVLARRRANLFVGMAQSVMARDYPVVFLDVILNARRVLRPDSRHFPELMDIVYVMVDPRIRHH